MQQPYLDIARHFVLGRQPFKTLDAGGGPFEESPGEPEPSAERDAPVSLASYREGAAARRCHLCGYALSVVSVRDVCGRCVLRESTPPIARAIETIRNPGDDERQLRGRMLAALDRRNFPKLHLGSGHTVGPGLLEWGPVLREMNLRALQDIERVLARLPGSMDEVYEP